MNERKRVFVLILIMAVVALAAAGITIALLYRTALEEEKARLVETAHSQARLIEAIARFNAVYSKNFPGGPEAATLGQIVDAHQQYKGFGKTGEFTLARHKGDTIVFELSHRHLDLQNPKPVPFDSELAEPMRRALSGLSGTVVGLDYRGETVLAAHEPVRELDFGIVAKIDLAEVRAPFLRSGLIAGSLAMLAVLGGVGLFLRISNPMIARLEGHAAELEIANDQLKLEISERQEAEAALRESEQRFRAIFEQAAIGVAQIVSKTGEFVRINQEYCDIVGYTEEEMTATTFMAITHPDDLRADLDNMKRLLDGEIREFTMEKRYFRKDGSIVWVNLTVSPMWHIGEEPTYHVAVVEDITERKKLEQALLESEAKYRSMMEAMIDPVYICSPDYRVQYMNPAMIKRVGGDRRGEPCHKVMHELDEKCPWCVHEKVQQGGFPMTTVASPKDSRTYLVSNSPIFHTDASISKMTIFRDITELKQIEKALREARDELEQREEERTAELVRINEELKREIEDRKRTQQALRESEESVRKINVELDQGLSEVFQALRKIASGDPSVRIPETSELDLLVKLKHAVNVTAQDLATIVNLAHEFAMGLAEYFDVLQRVSRGDFTARVSGDSPIDLLEALKRDINQMIEDISTEIAERKRVEHTLLERQASLAEAQRIAHLGNWDWNIETNELRWSDEIYRIFGLTPQEFGATYEAFLNSVHPDDRETVKKAVDQALNEDRPYSIDHRIVLPDGTERIVHEQAGITFDTEGKPFRMIGTVQDITERKQAERALEESEGELRRLSSRLLRVQEAERETISRELHDSIGQSLAAIKFGVENCLHRIREVADRETVKSLEALVPVVRRASEEVRRIHTDLRPSLLDDLGIIATISWFCREFQELYSDVRVEPRIDIEEKQVADSLKIVIFRLLQEALNNVAKYGQGDTVRVSLRETEGHIELAIKDNGRGFDVEKVRSAKSLKGGFGLTSMKERTELSGGTFSIESAPGAGTLVRASWPTRMIEPT